MRARLIVGIGLAASLLVTLFQSGAARAQDKPQLSVGVGFGVGFLPFYVTQTKQLFEMRAAAAGIAGLQVGYRKFSGSSAMQDAILSGNVDVGGYGVPALLIAWEKTRNTANAIVGVAGITTTPLVLVSSNPAVRALQDFGPKDRIAMPALVSPQMYVLQMAAEQAFGGGKHDQLRNLVVALPHPDAVAALLSGGTEVDAYFSTPPFTSVVLRDPKVHRVVSSVDVFGGPSSFLVLGATKRFTDRNTALTKAIVAALGDAYALIKSDPRQAAEIYLKAEPSKTLGVDDIEALLRDPDNRFSLAPYGIMAYAEFMRRRGELKATPARWQDVFLPLVHDQPGS